MKIRAVRGGAITGRVSTDDDQPLPKAEIKLLRKQDGRWLPVNFTWEVSRIHRKDLRTDPNGVCLPAITWFALQDRRLILTKFPYLTTCIGSGSFMMAYYPSATSVEEARPVTVVEGSESTGIDIRLPDGTPYSIAGRVLGPENQPGFSVSQRTPRQSLRLCGKSLSRIT